MNVKESQLDIDIVESHFENDEEQASTAKNPSSAIPGALGNHCDGVYDNGHHSIVRRSSDDREKDLFLEEQNQRQSSLFFNESWYPASQESQMAQPASVQGRDGLPGSSGTSNEQSVIPSKSGLISSSPTLRTFTDHSSAVYSTFQHSIDDLSGATGISNHELEQSVVSSERGSIFSSPTLSSLTDHSNGAYDYSQHSEVRSSFDDKQEDLYFNEGWYSDPQERQLASLGGQDGLSMASSFEIATDELERTVAETLEGVSLRSTNRPQQEDGSCVRDSLVSGIVKEAKSPRDCCMDDESSPNDKQPTLFDLCLFKRRIISGDQLEHALYVIPHHTFHEVFPKIKKDEALVYHGTEFPIGEEHETMSKCSLHRRLEITDNLQVSFEVVHGQNFLIANPYTTTATLDDIRHKSMERIVAGFSVQVLTRCTGDKDELHEDNIRIILKCGNTNLYLIFPIAYYEASVFPLNDFPVVPMPQEDREALRSCHVALLDNIGDAISLCDHLYQHKILDSGDLEEINGIAKKRDRNAYVLRTIQTRGNILDFVIKLMQAKRENQGAAAILQKRRHHGTDM